MPVRILEFCFAGLIFWKMTKYDYATCPISTLADYAIINPLLYEAILDNGSNGNQHYHMLGDHSILFSTNRILIAYDGNYEFDGELIVDNIIPVIERLVRNIRWCSGQATIKPELFMIKQHQIGRLPQINIPSNNVSKVGYMAHFLIHSAVTWEHLVSASSLYMNYTPPVYEGLLLDAVEAGWSDQFATSILYSAIAMEVAAGTKLDEAYEINRQNEVESNKMRFVTFTLPGDRKERKDPVFEYLKGREDFSQLLHVRSLYVLDRSMLVENERLYNDALRLYRTRNKIAHRGEIPIESNFRYAEMNRDGVVFAIKTTIDVFQWFGIMGNYVVPEHKFEKIGI